MDAAPTENAEAASPAAQSPEAAEAAEAAAKEATAPSAEDIARTQKARIVLQRVDEAIAALDRGEAAPAMEAVTAGRQAIDELLSLSPTMVVAERVVASGVDTEHRAELSLGPDLVPILEDITRSVDLVPDPLALKEAMEEPAEGGLVVADASIRYHELALPVGGTALRLTAAQQLLEEGDLEQARLVLSDAVMNLDALDLVEDAPIVLARRSFRCASTAFAQGNRDLASSCLELAHAQVEEAAKEEEASAAERHAAVALADDVGRLQESLNQGTVPDAAQRRGLGARFWGATQRWGARMAVARHESRQLSAAADALSYLETAEAHQFYDQDEKKALKAREKAHERLTEGLAIADDSLRPRFAKALTLMEAIDQTPLVDDSVEAHAAIDELQFELRRVLFQL